MRLLAEERKTGTIELLLTKAVSERQIVLGKFLSTLLLIMIAMAFTLPYVITISSIGNIDLGQIICGYVGLILMSSMYTSIGLYTSTTTTNQIVAFLLAILTGLFFHIIFGLLAQQFPGWLGQVFDYLNMSTHFESMSRGVLDTRDLTYFVSITIIGILLSGFSLTKRQTA
jgi:ABC-2 type transport system permease protein